MAGKASRMRALALFMAVWMLLTVLPVGPVGAALVPTGDLLPDRAADAAREKIRSLLTREDVQAHLAALSDAEAREFGRRIDALPAGSGVIGVLVTAILIIFLVLLLTDLLGLTDVFPFVRKHR